MAATKREEHNEFLIEILKTDSSDDDDDEGEKNLRTEDESDSVHTLQIQQTANGAVYQCQHCNKNFPSIQEFDKAHQFIIEELDDEDMATIEEPQWELIDDVEEVVSIVPTKKTKKSINVEGNFVEEIVYNEQYLEEQCADEVNDIQLRAVPVKQETETDEFVNERFYCFECEQVFSDMDTAEQHNCPGTHMADVNVGANKEAKPTAKNKINIIMCFLCKGRFVSTEKLKQHQLICARKHTTAKEERGNIAKKVVSHRCQVCNNVFDTAKELYEHKRITHKKKGKEVKSETTKKISICDICNTEFSSEKNLKLHVKIHDKRPTKTIQEALPAGSLMKYNKRSKFFCEICSKSFDESLMAIHQNMHRKYEEFNCSICNRQFENLPSFEMHKQMHEGKSTERQFPVKEYNTKKRMFPCQYCGRVFPRPHEKVKHERVHTGEKPFACEVCGKTFRVSYSLTLHLRTHTNIRPYVCPTCNKRFKSQPTYMHHLRTHTDDKPFKCEDCKKSFRTSVQLCGHKNCHLKPFLCPECNRPFATLYHVKVHMASHNKLTTSNDSLQHRCNICGAEYVRFFGLRFHMKEQHNIILKTKETGALDDESAAVVRAAAEEATDIYMDRDESSESEMATTTEHYNVRFTMGEEYLEDQEIIVDHYQTEEVVGDIVKKERYID